MRVVLADLEGRGGFVNKDTVAGGYGSRFQGTSWTTRIAERLRNLYQNLPSIQMGYLAAIFAQAGHEVCGTSGRLVEGDLALILSSIVDFRHEVVWAKAAKRKCGMRVGFLGTFATYVTDALLGHGDFVIKGEPEHAAMRLAAGDALTGVVLSSPIQDLDFLPFPRWDLLPRRRFAHATGRSPVPARTAFPVLSSRSCPEFCTYCPHRIIAPYRTRRPESVLEEIAQVCRRYGTTYLVFRDPLFTRQRERSIAIAEGILRKKLPVRFGCETRLDDLDKELIGLLHRAGLRTLTFGVESVDPMALKRVARRPIPPEHQMEMVSYCNKKGIMTVGFYVFGFLTDTLESIRATIDYSIQLNSTLAQFKILTPYPGTPLRRQMEALITERDLEKFDGYTPTFCHPNLTQDHLLLMLKTAYSRFYVRPSWAWNYLGFPTRFAEWVRRTGGHARCRHRRVELACFQPQESAEADTLPAL